MRSSLIGMAAFAAFCIPGPAAQARQEIPAHIAAGVAGPQRGATSVARDALRKPAETLVFAGLEPGMKVMDLVPGGGYFTRILSVAVGSEGHVYALQPYEVVDTLTAYRKVMEDMDAEPGWENVTFSFDPAVSFTTPEPLDMVFTALNYHDFHADFMGPADVGAINRAVFNALKPGGIYFITDHHAVAGSGLADVNRLHRIDVEVVKREVLAAGFVLEAESDLLAHPDDDRTRHVYLPEMRGRTDQFTLKFRKPG